MSSPVAPDSAAGSANPLPLLALSDRMSDRTRKLIGAYWAGHAAYKIGKRYWDKAKEQRTYTITVADQDSIYADLHRWLLAMLPPDRQRSVTVRTTSSGMDMAGPMSKSSGPPDGLKLFYDGSRSQSVVLDGQTIVVAIDRPDWARDSDDSGRWRRGLEHMVFTASSLRGREAIMAFLAKVYEAQTKSLPHMWSPTQWSDSWQRMDDVPTRSFDTVFLAAGQQDRLLADLGLFLSEETTYAAMGWPWHRGYLFHGPPGTGKTSIAKALANHFGLDVYYLPVTALRDDALLNALFARVPARAVVLLEDIDIVQSARSANIDRPEGGVTLQGLLNCLDGFTTPHGLILIMTSNRPASLDERLVRAGRIDMKLEISYLDDDQFGRLAEPFVGAGRPLPVVASRKVTPAEIIDVFKRNLHDPDRAVAELWDRYDRLAVPAIGGGPG